MQLNVTEEDIRKSVALTGYRPNKLPFGYDFNHPDALRLKAILKNEYRYLIEQGYTCFLTGGALGCDMMAAEVILELKQEYRHDAKVWHILCAPCYHYTKKWNDADRERLNRIAKKSSSVVFVSETEYYNGCMQKRNRYMVDTSGLLLAVYDGQPGGTKYTVDYARSQNKKVIILNPKELLRVKLIETPQDVDFMMNYNNPFKF